MDPAGQEVPGGDGSSLRILLLEDNPGDVELCLRELRRADPSVQAMVASSLREFRQCLETGTFDVILADYFLPTGTGMDALMLLNQMGLETPLILLTGVLGDEQAVECIKRGARDYVLKQRLARLPTAVRRVMEESRLRAAERRGREALALLAAIVESSNDAVVGLSLEGRITTWNSGAEKMYGFTAQEAVGRPVSIIVPPDGLLTGALRLGELHRPRRVHREESVRVRKDGHRIPVLLTVSPVKDAAGEIVGASEIAHDITDRKRLESQLRKQNRRLEAQNRQVMEATRLKSQFLTNISHELRSPLNGIIGLCEMLHDGRFGPLSEEQLELLGDVLQSAKHLLQLINGLLDLGKVEAGKLEFRPQAVSLERLVHEVIHGIRATAEAKGIRIDVQTSPDLKPVVVDPQRTKQVLYNYLSNAVKFTAQGGQVIVRAVREPPRHFRLEVEDTGIGIEPKDMGRLFLNFEQLDAGAGKKFQGSGLGLALTKRIVEAQGGRVWARSQPGRGSTFYAVLPCAPIRNEVRAAGSGG